ncbi:DUF992 domain-containing protein [Bradyrhizobium sp. USDA 4353]
MHRQISLCSVRDGAASRGRLGMMRRYGLLVLAMNLAILVSPAFGQAAPPVPGVKSGILSCRLSPTIGFIVGSVQTISCVFTAPDPYPREAYIGTISTFGVDIGVVAGGQLAWAVFSPTAGPLRDALAGTYVGGSGDVDVGVGVGANVLFGGSGRSIALQPISVEGEVGLSLQLGISTMTLRPAS